MQKVGAKFGFKHNVGKRQDVLLPLLITAKESKMKFVELTTPATAYNTFGEWALDLMRKWEPVKDAAAMAGYTGMITRYAVHVHTGTCCFFAQGPKRMLVLKQSDDTVQERSVVMLLRSNPLDDYPYLVVQFSVADGVVQDGSDVEQPLLHAFCTLLWQAECCAALQEAGNVAWTKLEW